MSFQKFVKHGENFTARASIWTKGLLSINAGAFNLYELTDKQYATLYYDPEHHLVGLTFHAQPRPGTVQMLPRKTGGVIPCKSFFNKYGIDYSVVRNYVLAWSEKAKMFAFDLDLPIENKECPEYPDAEFAEYAFTGLFEYLDRQDGRLPTAKAAKLARSLFSMAAHHHMNIREIRAVIEKAQNPQTAHKDKLALRIHKTLTS